MDIMRHTDLLADLNEAQREAVTTTEGYVRVVAGAGSGKTRALSRRFAYLVLTLGVAPGNILCVTFTNKAAGEMRQRIRALTGDEDTGYVNTFHGFCVSVLQEDSSAIAFPKSFLVLDNEDINAMLSLIYEERGLTLRDYTYAKARDMFEIRKTISETGYFADLIDLSPDALREKYLAATEPADILFYGYLWQQKKCFGLDYNDLIVLTLEIFRRRDDIREKWQQRLQYIMVDEFQDIDALQYRLMEVLATRHGNLFVVGDPDQTIYTWRGADMRFLMDFPTRFPGTRTIMMNGNYRSTPAIVAVANSLIAANRDRIPKDLFAAAPDAEAQNLPVTCYFGKTADDEAAWMVRQMESLHDAGLAWRDMCVLYRAHYASRPVEEALMRRKVPYTIYSGAPFFERKEVKDALAYLRMAVLRDDLSFARIANVPKRNLGQRRMAFLREYADERGIPLFTALKESLDEPVMAGTKAREFVDLVDRFGGQAASRPASELLGDLLDKSGYERMLRTEGSQERLDNLAELKQALYEFETTCGEETAAESFLAHAALMTNQDAAADADKVKLMTIHAAKGLEFPVVFLCALDEGILPSRKTATLAQMEEERRLAFVAITRAERGLALSCGGGTTHDGQPRYPSRFVLDIAPGLMRFVNPPQDSLIRDARAYYRSRDERLLPPEESGLIPVGARVRHAAFGEGTVKAIDTDAGSYEIAFDRLPTTRNLTFRAPLERIE